MSYPSIGGVLERCGITDPQVAAAADLDVALLEAFQIDLPLGAAYVADLAAEVQTTGIRTLRIEDPNSALGRQLVRLLGTDIARSVLGRRHGVAFGLYNCCAPVCALTVTDLAMTAAEQINLQNGVLASADLLVQPPNHTGRGRQAPPPLNPPVGN